jgi:hypothetical protein
VETLFSVTDNILSSSLFYRFLLYWEMFQQTNRDLKNVFNNVWFIEVSFFNPENKNNECEPQKTQNYIIWRTCQIHVGCSLLGCDAM